MALEAAAKGVLTTNCTNLSASVPGYARTIGLLSNGKSQAVMAEVTNSVLDAMADPNRGPWYASALVQSAKGTDLIAAVRGIGARATRKRVHEAAQEAKGMPIGDNFAKAKDEFFKCPKIPILLKMRYDAFVGATRELTRCRIRRDSYDALANLADNLAGQPDGPVGELGRLKNGLTDPFEKAVGELLNIFSALWTDLTNFVDGTNDYMEPIVTMKQIAPELNKEINSCDVDHVGKGLLGSLLSKEGRAAWGPEGDDALLAYLVSHYFAETFKVWSQRSLKTYLEDRYGICGNDQLLAQKVQGGLMKRMGNRADVLFRVATGYVLPASSTLCYVTVPQNSPVVANAAAGYVAAQGAGYSVRMTSAADRVSFLRLQVGVPLWGYGEIATYEAG